MGFEVQRGISGIDFNKIDFINTKAINGNSNLNLNYNVSDLDFPPGINYYRLKQIDKDGKFSFSKIVVLKNSNLETDLISVYPNPVKNTLNIKITSNMPGKKTLLIFDINGKQLKRKVVEAVNGEIVSSIDVSDFTPGMYLLKIIHPNEHDNVIVKFEKK